MNSPNPSVREFQATQRARWAAGDQERVWDWFRHYEDHYTTGDLTELVLHEFLLLQVNSQPIDVDRYESEFPVLAAHLPGLRRCAESLAELVPEAEGEPGSAVAILSEGYGVFHGVLLEQFAAAEAMSSQPLTHSQGPLIDDVQSGPPGYRTEQSAWERELARRAETPPAPKRRNVFWRNVGIVVLIWFVLTIVRAEWRRQQMAQRGGAVNERFVRDAQRAVKYVQSGEYDKAGPLLDELLREQPRNESILALRSFASWRTGEPEAAVATARILLKWHPENLGGYEVLLGVYVEEQKPEEAIRAATDLLQADVGDEGRLVLLEFALPEIGTMAEGDQTRPALDLMNLAAGRYPDNASILWGRAVTERSLGQNRECIRDCRAVVLKRPEFDPAWGVLAEALMAEGDTEGALDAIERALILDPDWPGYRELREQIRTESGAAPSRNG